MIKKEASNKSRVRRHERVRKTISGTAERPRLNVFRSNKGIYAQVIDDVTKTTLASSSNLELKIANGGNIEAAKAVNAHEFIMKLDKGYDTELLERGGGLSIGQKQILALARTMVSKPKILILDEATSSIDTKTELIVQKGIDKLLSGRTSFVIAHRLSTIKKADRIFVVDNGKIIEEGNHRQLLEKKGAYYNLYMAQFNI